MPLRGLAQDVDGACLAMRTRRCAMFMGCLCGRRLGLAGLSAHASLGGAVIVLPLSVCLQVQQKNAENSVMVYSKTYCPCERGRGCGCCCISLPNSTAAMLQQLGGHV